MSAKADVSVEKQKRNDVYLDFHNVISKLKRERAIDKRLGDIGSEMGLSNTSMTNLLAKAPNTVAKIYYFLKDNNLSFEDLVKEIEVQQ